MQLSHLDYSGATETKHLNWVSAPQVLHIVIPAWAVPVKTRFFGIRKYEIDLFDVTNYSRIHSQERLLLRILGYSIFVKRTHKKRPFLTDFIIYPLSY